MLSGQSYYTVRSRTITLHVCESPGDVPHVPDPESAIPILRGIFETLDADREHFVILACDAKNRMRGFKVVSTGSTSRSVVDPKNVFRDALALGAFRLLLAHNHPSGDPEPSPDDVATTRRLVSGGSLLGIPVTDHIILGDGERWVSLLRRGCLDT